MVDVIESLEHAACLVYEMVSHPSALFLVASMLYSMAWYYFGSLGSSTSFPFPSLDYIMFSHDVFLGRISYNNLYFGYWYILISGLESCAS